jgi:hypothetical protein
MCSASAVLRALGMCAPTPLASGSKEHFGWADIALRHATAFRLGADQQLDSTWSSVWPCVWPSVSHGNGDGYARPRSRTPLPPASNSTGSSSANARVQQCGLPDRPGTMSRGARFSLVGIHTIGSEMVRGGKLTLTTRRISEITGQGRMNEAKYRGALVTP